MPSEISRHKCVVLGDSKVGKTAIVQALMGQPFASKYTMTPGVEISVKGIRPTNSDSLIECFIYDFSGKDLYTPLTTQLWSKNVSIIIGVFDVNREESFYSLQSQMTELLKEITNQEQVIGLIL